MSKQAKTDMPETQTSETPGDVKPNNEPRLHPTDEPKSEQRKRAQENETREEQGERQRG